MNRIRLLCLDRPPFIDRLAEYIDEAAQGFAADRHRDRSSGILHIHSARQTIGRGHRDAADSVFAQVRSNFKGDSNGRCTRRLILFLRHLDRIVDVG